jgi:hypothetical protein
VGVVGRIMTIALMGLFVVGCGGDGGDGDNDNDNGISFRAVGFFQGTFQDNRCEVPTAADAIADPSNNLVLNDVTVDSGYPTGIFFCRAFLWLENNLVNQAVVVDRLDFEYEIPGSRIGIPPHSSSVGIRINPAPVTQPDNPPAGSPLPPPDSPFGPPNVYIGSPQGQIVPASLVLFLRQNQQALPQLPYTMIVRMTAHARTDAGDGLVSNEVGYTINWDNELQQQQ